MTLRAALRRMVDNLLHDPDYTAPPKARPPEPVTDDRFKRQQAALDAMHWTEQLGQLRALQATINAEITAIRDTRDKVKRLEALQGSPAAYVELAATIDRRDYSERREATLQRQLITVSNQIYTAQKRIAKAERIAAGMK